MPRFSGCHVRVSCSLEGRAEAGAADPADYACEDADADLRIEGESLALAFFDDEGPIVFVGTRTPEGDYELHCRSRPRTGNLRPSADGRVYEGRWQEGAVAGTWRIALPGRDEAGDDRGSAV